MKCPNCNSGRIIKIREERILPTMALKVTIIHCKKCGFTNKINRYPSPSR